MKILLIFTIIIRKPRPVQNRAGISMGIYFNRSTQYFISRGISVDAVYQIIS